MKPTAMKPTARAEWATGGFVAATPVVAVGGFPEYCDGVEA